MTFDKDQEFFFFQTFSKITKSHSFRFTDFSTLWISHASVIYHRALLPWFSHGSGQPLAATPAAQVVQSKQEEAWKRTRVGGSAPLTDFPPADPFADAPSRGPITVIHSRETQILLRGTGTYRRRRPIFAENNRITLFSLPPTPILRRIALSGPLAAGWREGGAAGWKRFAGQASEREDGSEWESECGRDARNESTRATVRASGVKMRRTGVAQARPLVQGRRRSQLRAEAACRCVPLSRDTSARFGNAVPRQSRSGEDAARVKRRDRQAIRKGGDRDRDRECKSGRSVVDTVTDSFAYWMLDRSSIIFLGYVMSIVNNTNRCCYGYIEQLWLLYL